jgi:hypothetical protein
MTSFPLRLGSALYILRLDPWGESRLGQFLSCRKFDRYWPSSNELHALLQATIEERMEWEVAAKVRRVSTECFELLKTHIVGQDNHTQCGMLSGTI